MEFSHARTRTNNIALGTVIGVLTPMLVFVIFYLIQGLPAGESFYTFYFKYYIRSVLPNILSLCAIPNVLFFWLFLQKRNYQTSKGIILSLFILLIWVLIEKVF